MAEEVLAHGITRESGQSNVVVRGMARHPELCFVLLTLAFTFLSNYGTSFKSKPLVVPARMPRPLFSAFSPVVDLYQGDLHSLVQMLHHEDLIFVMYYAPWCARSQAVSSQFQTAAKFMAGKVQFVAVNCWYPEGLCRKQYKFLLFPVFFAYHHNNDGYRYLGVDRAEFMVKFLEDLLSPLTALRHDDDVRDFVVQHDSAVVGYFDWNSSPQPPDFQQFYYAAMRLVERDPGHPVKFGVISDTRLAAQWNLTHPSDAVFLRINNSTLKFLLRNNMTSSNIVSWVLENRNELPARWVVPLGLKSLLLSREIEKGPAVILFHKVTPLSTASQTYSLFKDLALHYNLCPGDRQAEDASHRWLALSARNVLDHQRRINSCLEYKRTGQGPLPNFRCCVSTITASLGDLPHSTLNVCEVCHHKARLQQHSLSACVFPPSSKGTGSTRQVFGFLLPPSNSCSNWVESYDWSSHTSVCCQKYDADLSDSQSFSVPYAGSLYRTSTQGRRPTDRYVLESLEKLPRRLCERIKFQKAQNVFPSTVIPDFGSKSYPASFTGGGCRANHTLTFISLDSHSHWMFAESLGLDLSQAHHTPVVVAFDTEREEQYVLRGNFTKKNTASFILSFTEGSLQRDLRSIPSLGHPDNPQKETVYVTELDTQTFRAAIEEPKDVVLLVYARWCGVCSSFSHTFLHLAKYFHSSPNITFVRVNGENNDLPWEFSMDSYPTVVFFPAFRKSDSVSFPSTVSLTLPNLIRFVLQHAAFSTRFHLAADVCSLTCIQQNLELARRLLHSLRTKLARLQLRYSILGSSSHYQLATKEFLQRQISQSRLDIDKVQTLKKYLEVHRGSRLDRAQLEQLFQEILQGRGTHLENENR